jgi:hypothetical protein
MSTSFISSLDFARKQVTIYGGTSMIVTGVLGGLLNTIVFLSLSTFRQSSCAFYLTIMSILNTTELLTDVLSRVTLSIYNTDGTDTSLIYYKFRSFFTQVCTVISLTCFCLATIDQYCATSCHSRLQQLCNIKRARCLVIIFICIWILHGIPYLVLYVHIVSPLTGEVTCTMTNAIYIQYRSYVIVLILVGFLPVSVAIVFGLMTFHNVQQMAHYTVPLVRRELDRQLTAMILVQVVVNCFALLPFTIMNTITLDTSRISDPVFQAEIRLDYTVTFINGFIYHAVSSNWLYFTARKFEFDFCFV